MLQNNRQSDIFLFFKRSCVAFVQQSFIATARVKKQQKIEILWDFRLLFNDVFATELLVCVEGSVVTSALHCPVVSRCTYTTAFTYCRVPESLLPPSFTSAISLCLHSPTQDLHKPPGNLSLALKTFHKYWFINSISSVLFPSLSALELWPGEYLF